MKSMMSPEATKYLRTWQRNFINKKFCPKHVTGSEHNLWFANCCTGSGKSNIGFETVIQNIMFNESLGRKSINVFVAPTIMLSKQIKNECEDYLQKFYPTMKNKVEFVLRNCESEDSRVDLAKTLFGPNNPKARHHVFVYCADSFFGNETIGNRYDAIYKGLKKTITKNKDIVCGTIVFDEAHNYRNRWEEITGYVATSSQTINPATQDINILTDLFSDVVCMTGTPCVYQCWMSQDERWAKDYVVSVNYATAIKNRWILRPDVYVLMVRDVKSQLEDAAITAMTNERSINASGVKAVANTTTHMLINAPDINTANNVGKNLWKFYDGNVGVSILHSPKAVKDTSRGKNRTFDMTAEIDGVPMGSKQAKESIMAIDSTDYARERIVTQVEMISEGINVNSFDCPLITSHSDVKIIQQVGRSLRFLDEKVPGVKNHASIYCVAENQEDVAILVSQLVDQGLDLEEILKNMKIADVRGKGKPEDEDAVADYEKSAWRVYTKVEIKNLMNMVNGATVEARIKNYVNRHASAIDLIYSLISASKISVSSGGKKAATKTEKSGKSSSTKGGSGTNAGNGKKNKEITSLGKKNAILRRIEDRITKVNEWRDLYIPNMQMDKVINYMLNDLCGVGEAPTLTTGQAAILRDFIAQVDIEMHQAEAANQI